MSEGALVFVSIIIGLAATDMLVSLHRLMRVRRQVKWDWLTLVLAALVLLMLVQVWWGMAGEPAGSVTIGAFLPQLVTLILMFLLAAGVLPDDPGEGMDLRAFYDENAGYLWTLFSGAIGWSALIGTIERLNRGAGILEALDSRAGDVGVTMLAASLIFVRRRWWHAIGIGLLSLMPLIWLGRSLS